VISSLARWNKNWSTWHPEEDFSFCRRYDEFSHQSPSAFVDEKL